jgi:hypothetical protein
MGSMALTFAFEEDLDVILCPEKTATFAFAFCLALHHVSPKVTAKLANRLPCESLPIRVGVAVGHVDDHGGLSIAHVGDNKSGNFLSSIIRGSVGVRAIIFIMIGTVDMERPLGSPCSP